MAEVDDLTKAKILALKKKQLGAHLSDDESQAVGDYIFKPQEETIRERAELQPEVLNFANSMVGRGTFRDSGRQSEGLGESLDSMVGAPARVAIDRLQDGDPRRALVDAMSQYGKDPSTAPTGVDIASRATDNPYLGTALATAVDVGAQIPMPVRLGMNGVIKKLDGPLYHGTEKNFLPKEIRPSRGGFVGPGVYMADEAKVAGRYGENVLAYNPKEVNILDLMANDDDALLAAKQLGIEEAYLKRIAKDRGYSVPEQTGRFYALQDSLIDKIDPNFKLIGNERAEALIKALKEKGYTGLKYKHQDAPAFNIFDAENIKPAHKYTVRNKEDQLDLYSEPARASGELMYPDTVSEVDPEIMDHLEKAGIDPQKLFRLNTLESDISGYGEKALKKMEESAKKRGAEVSYLNASPMGILGIPQGMTQESSAAKLRDYYQKQGYETVKDYGTNTMMLKKLRGELGLVPDSPALISALRNRQNEKEKRK